MKKYIYFLVVSLFILTSCADNWDNHYTNVGDDTDNSGSTLNLLEFLESDSKYSKFVELLKETEIAEELTRNQVLTVWAPSNETMPEAQIAAMSAADKKTLCQNHLNYIALYNTKLEDGKLVKTLAGKNLVITEPSLDVFTIDGYNVIELNQKCTNGVVHDVDGWIIPRKSIYEYILEAGDSYSVFRDSILAQSDTVFKPSLSYPLGVDELGNTIYDSVFVIENSLFNRGDLRDEDNDFTLFIPSNQVIDNMYKEMNEYFASIGGAMTGEDSTLFFRWMLISVIHEGKIEDPTASYYSVYNYEWRGDKQALNPDYKVCSNGYVYDIEKLHVPKFLYLETIQSHFYWIGEIPEPERNNYYSMGAGTTFNQWAYKDTETVAWFNVTLDTEFELKTVLRDYDLNIIDGKVMPGFYKISMSFRTWWCGAVEISINDEYVTTTPVLNSNSGTYNFKAGVIAEEFEIKDEWGYEMLNVKFKSKTTPTSAGMYNRITPSYILLEPTRNNY